MGDLRGPVLLVDDEPAIGKVLAALLGQIDVRCISVDSGEAALEVMDRQPIELVICDLRMPGMDGMTLLRRVNQTWPDVPVVLLTAHGSVPLAVEAMKAGARDFLLKPFDRDEVVFVVEKVLATQAQAGDALPSRAQAELTLLGESQTMCSVRDLVRRAAASPSTVLIQGETGTGKELVARAIHESSARREGAFVTLNSAAIPEHLLESELFGYEKGAFTGACSRKPGRIELAQSGTLFLDEVGDMPLGTQAKLLRVLQEREIERLGGTQTIPIDVRVVAATHRNLDAMVGQGRFREDLYYRLNVIPIDVPPLRERAEDIALLVQHFSARVAGNTGRPSASVEAGAIDLLKVQPFPGNVRQLENLVERLIVLSDTGRVARAAVEAELRREADRQRAQFQPPIERTTSLDDERRRAERSAIERALASAGNNRALAARLLGVSRRTLYNKLDEFGLA